MSARIFQHHLFDVHDDDFKSFLKVFVAWLENLKPKKGRSAMTMVRQAMVPGSLSQKVFPGLDVYTVDKVCYIAGAALPSNFILL